MTNNYNFTNVRLADSKGYDSVTFDGKTVYFYKSDSEKPVISLDTGAIVGIVVGVVCFIAIVVIGVIVIMKKKTKTESVPLLKDEYT